MSLAWHNGKFTPKDRLTVSPDDFGFSRGLTIFEFLRVYGGFPFRMDDHLSRLLEGAEVFGIKSPLTGQEITEVVMRLIAENRFAHSTVKFHLTAGTCSQYNAASFVACGDFNPQLMISETEFKPSDPEAPYGAEMYKTGQRLKTVPFTRDFPTVKSTNYTLAWHAAQKTAGKEWDDILFTDRGYIGEAARSNFFALIDGVLCTPKDGVLFGITRKVILELASDLGIPTAERPIAVTELSRFSEAFTTGSTIELLPARQIDDHALSSTTDGPIFTALRRAFTRYIGSQTQMASPTMVA